MKHVGRIKNWSKFQHYKNRCPPWIKLERKLLDDFEFSRLPIASKALLPLLWLLASESNEGSFDADISFLAFRLRWTEDDVRSGLIPLIDKEFISCASELIATCQHDAIPETEGEGETEGDLSNPKGLEVGKDSDAPKRKIQNCPVQKIIDLYHEILLPELPAVEKVTKTREGYIRQRWLQDLQELDHWRNYFQDVKRSNFLMGRVDGRDGKPPFRADLEWLTRPGNFTKVAEGKYHR